MRSTSSSMFALGGIWRNESATCRHHHVIYSGKIISIADNQGSEFSRGGLLVFL